MKQSTSWNEILHASGTGSRCSATPRSAWRWAWACCCLGLQHLAALSSGYQSRQLAHAVHLQAHTNVDVRVDIPAFRALLADRLPLVFAGWPVEAAHIPWPVQEGAEEAETGSAEHA